MPPIYFEMLLDFSQWWKNGPRKNLKKPPLPFPVVDVEPGWRGCAVDRVLKPLQDLLPLTLNAPSTDGNGRYRFPRRRNVVYQTRTQRNGHHDGPDSTER